MSAFITVLSAHNSLSSLPLSPLPLSPLESSTESFALETNEFFESCPK